MNQDAVSVIRYYIVDKNEYYMKEALKEAKKAYKIGEIPVGAIIVYNDQIIARGYNKREKNQSTISHAELEAIKKANKKIGSWRLEDCILYVTLEPCAMCAGAIIQARIKEVYYSAKDPKTGALGSVINLFDHKFNHQVLYHGGLLEEQSKNLIQSFFKDLRNSK